MFSRRSRPAFYTPDAFPTPTALSRRRFLRTAGIVSAGLVLGPGGAAASVRDASESLQRENKMQSQKGSKMRNAVADVARPLPLPDVRLTGGPLKHAQDLDAKYLLALEPDRMMAFFRKRVDLEPKAPGYGGWDGDGRNLTGHIAGHYLSAVSLMYAATGDPRFKQRANYLVEEMALVQGRAGNGYLGALEGAKESFTEVSHGDIRSGGFDLNGLWSPWYVEHKLFAGLRDAYRHTGNRKALDVETHFAAWAESIVSPLTDAQDQKMLNTEFGGMNEVLADLFHDTGDYRWMTLSDKFEHRAVRDPLARQEYDLGGLHANTQIPKLIGSLARYIYTGNETDGAAARYFWDAVVLHQTFATGGHGKDEYFGPADQLSARVNGRTDESCNVYNMLKMTRTLFALHPDIKFAEYQERALFNHALGSMDPADGRTCYMVPVGQGVQHEYQDMFESFTCCVGTGMENHALHGHGIYYEDGQKLWVNLYTPSKAEWRSAGVSLALDTSFPEGEQASLNFTVQHPRAFALLLRRPSWAGNGFAVTVNGHAVKSLPEPGSYVEIERVWKTGDAVALTLPKTLREEPLPDNPRRTALLWGPLVLAGDMGPEREEDASAPPTPVFVAANQPVAKWLKPVAGASALFRTDGVGRDTSGSGHVSDVELVPFYRLHRRTYTVYWDLYTPAEWDQKATAIAAAQEKQRHLESATVGFAQPGEMQPERNFNEQGEDTTPDRVLGRPGRRGRKWFSFDMPVDPLHPMTLIVTYSTQEFRERTFNIEVNGTIVGQQKIERNGPGSASAEFFDVSYFLPANLIAGKSKVTVRFDATGGNEIAAVFGLRTIRTDYPVN
jgi:DUF1680 family protein